MHQSSLKRGNFPFGLRRMVIVAAGALGCAGAFAASSPVGNNLEGSTTRVVSAQVPGATPSFSTSTCVSCHQFNDVLSHPVGVVPSMPMTSDLPLVNGAVGCVTCHDAPPDHRSRVRKVGVRPGSTGLGLCADCHDAKAGTGSSHAAAGAMPAHLASDPEGSLTTGMIDRESASCLSCHDGAAASDKGAPTPEPHSIDAEESHPIGLAFRVPRDPAERDRLVSPRSLDDRIRLFNQTVGCGSCHSAYSRADKLLVMSNLKSRLCLSCHVE
jgi:predicted CXXCH cytochrome family protein